MKAPTIRSIGPRSPQWRSYIVRSRKEGSTTKSNEDGERGGLWTRRRGGRITPATQAIDVAAATTAARSKNHRKGEKGGRKIGWVIRDQHATGGDHCIAISSHNRSRRLQPPPFSPSPTGPPLPPGRAHVGRLASSLNLIRSMWWEVRLFSGLSTGGKS
jgi:hypothetical protein